MHATECLEYKPDECQGEVQMRDALSESGMPYVRCDFHWRKRIELQHELEQKYPDSPIPPPWFDPTYAGERWDDDY